MCKRFMEGKIKGRGSRSRWGETLVGNAVLTPMKVLFVVPTCYQCEWSSWGATGKGISQDPHGGWDFVESFVDDIKLERYPSNVPSPSVLPWKSPILSSAGLGLSPLSRVCAPY